MAILYRYETFKLNTDNTSTIGLLAYNSDNEGEQCLIEIDFPAGVTVNGIEAKITTVMNYVKALKRSEPA